MNGQEIYSPRKIMFPSGVVLRKYDFSGWGGGINFPLSLSISEHHAVNRVSIEMHSNSIFYRTLADNVSPVADANTSNNGETTATNGQPKVCVLSPILDCN